MRGGGCWRGGSGKGRWERPRPGGAMKGAPQRVWCAKAGKLTTHNMAWASFLTKTERIPNESSCSGTKQPTLADAITAE